MASPIASINAPPPFDNIVAHALIFYMITALGYALLPFMRRGDIALIGFALAGAVGFAPVLSGQDVGLRGVADVVAVALAAAPIYIARSRQVRQGDMRPHEPRRGVG